MRRQPAFILGSQVVLTLELANVGAAPIQLNPGMQICQIFLHEVENSSRASSTQFIGFRKPNLGQVATDATLRALSKEYFSFPPPEKSKS